MFTWTFSYAILFFFSMKSIQKEKKYRLTRLTIRQNTEALHVLFVEWIEKKSFLRDNMVIGPYIFTDDLSFSALFVTVIDEHVFLLDIVLHR